MRRESPALPRLALAAAVAALLGGCQAGSAAEPAGPRAGARTIPIPAFVAPARRAVRGEHRAEAFRVLAAERPLDVGSPERAWLLAQLLRGWCGSQYIRWQAAALPAGDVGDALRALTSEDPERALRRLGARRAGAEGAWRGLAAAHLHARLGDMPAGLRATRQALRSARAFVQEEAWLVRGRLLLGEGSLEAALAASRHAAALDPSDARPSRLAADVHKAAGRLDDAARALLEALTIAPESPRYALRLAQLLREPVSDETWRLVDEGLRSLPPAARLNAEQTALRALAAEHAQRGTEAIRLYRKALAEGAIPVPLDRDLRRMLVVEGQYAEAVALLFAAVPPEVIDDPRNLRRESWRALRAAVAAAPSGKAPAPARLALAQALLGVGALDEAVTVGLLVPGAEAAALVARVAGHLAFERDLRVWIEDGYRNAARKEDPPTWQSGLAHMRVLAERHLVRSERAAFANPTLGIRELPLLGAWLDHGARTTSPVVAHFRRYGRFLLYGQRSDTPVEAIVLSLASMTDDQPIRTGGRTYTHDVATGYDRALRSQIAAQGGALGGACLADGIWLDADAARRAEYEVRALLAWDPGYRRVALAAGALTADTLDGPTALTDPGCAAVRLLARYVDRAGRNAWGSFGTLRAHEFGHVRDIRRHLPLWPKLPATLGLVVRHGFSFHGVEMELEYRAQLVACAEAPDPDLALAEMLLALPVWAREPEVHDGGYRDALGAIVRHVLARPDLYPQIDRRRRIVTQLDRLSNPQIRAVARAVLQD